MRKKIWIKDINGNFHSYYKPISVGQEFLLLTELSDSRLTYDNLPQLITSVASIVLNLAPEQVEELFEGETLLKIFSSVREDLAREVEIPLKKKRDFKRKRPKKRRGEEEEGSRSYKEQLMELISFLLYYSNLTLDEILNNTKQFLIEIYVNLLEYIELERDFEFQISAVSALSALSGDSKGTRPEDGVFDLTSEEGFEALMSMPGLVEVK